VRKRCATTFAAAGDQALISSLLTYIFRNIGQEGTTIDVAGCSLIDVDRSTLAALQKEKLVKREKVGNPGSVVQMAR
jgi:hypothetical protein